MRPLNLEEEKIILVKEERTGRNYPVVGIEYRKAFPRTTVCILDTGSIPESKTDLSNLVIGITMRAKYESDIPRLGQIKSFVRALNQL